MNNNTVQHFKYYRIFKNIVHKKTNVTFQALNKIAREELLEELELMELRCKVSFSKDYKNFYSGNVLINVKRVEKLDHFIGKRKIHFKYIELLTIEEIELEYAKLNKSRVYFLPIFKTDIGVIGFDKYKYMKLKRNSRHLTKIYSNKLLDSIKRKVEREFGIINIDDFLK